MALLSTSKFVAGGGAEMLVDSGRVR